MLYLVLFSTLAVGFFAATTLSVQVSRNEKDINDAMLSAQSGMEYMRYNMGSIVVPSNTPDPQLLSVVAGQLGGLLNGTGNMNGDTVGNTGSEIDIPSSARHFVTLPGGQSFRSTITQSVELMVVTVTGYSGTASVTRAVQFQYQKAAKASAIFNYGVVSKGKVVTGGASYIIGQNDPTKGSVLSATMTDPVPVVIGGKQVSGDISVVNPGGTVSYGSNVSIGETNDPTLIPEHIHIGVQPPLFPTIDTSSYAAYATNKYVSGNTLTNCYIPPNTNPTFSGNTTITGVLLVQAPNIVNFKGNSTIQGCIVTDNSASLDLTHNKIIFSGNVAASSVSTLPASYGNLRQLTGAFLLANNFAVSISGNFGTVGGSIIASQITMSGNASGTVKGSVIGLNDVPMTINGSSDIYIASTGTSNYPNGVTFGAKYTPLPGTYTEVVP
jgi:hypothetical protein